MFCSFSVYYFSCSPSRLKVYFFYLLFFPFFAQNAPVFSQCKHFSVFVPKFCETFKKFRKQFTFLKFYGIMMNTGF